MSDLGLFLAVRMDMGSAGGLIVRQALRCGRRSRSRPPSAGAGGGYWKTVKNRAKPVESHPWAKPVESYENQLTHLLLTGEFVVLSILDKNNKIKQKNRNKI